MRSNPGQQILFTCVATGNSNKHIRQFPLLQFQMVAVPLQKELCQHSADPLIPVYKGMVSRQSIPKASNLFNI